MVIHLHLVTSIRKYSFVEYCHSCLFAMLIQVNVLGPCICIREAVKQMKERKVDDGHIILINRYRLIPYLDAINVCF